MTTTAMESRVLLGIFTPRLSTQSTSGSEKPSAANAEPRKPDNVMATWMVARNLAGSLVSLNRRLARLSPWSAIRSSLVSFMESTANSAQAKIAFSAISTNCKISNPNIILDLSISQYFFLQKWQKTQPIQKSFRTGRV